jgi:hypothetical protein
MPGSSVDIFSLTLMLLDSPVGNDSLMELGFVPQNRVEFKWEQQFNHLMDFSKKYGHCNISQSLKNIDYKNLVPWINTQRINYHRKAKRLTTKRIAKLKSIGFSWKNPIKRGDAIRIKDEDLLNELKRLHALSGIPPTPRYVNKHGKYPANTYANHFGGIVNARKTAGITSVVVVKRISDDQLLDDVKRLAVFLGKTPVTSDVIKHGKYSISPYLKRFGNIDEACKATGMNSVVHKKS